MAATFPKGVNATLAAAGTIIPRSRMGHRITVLDTIETGAALDADSVILMCDEIPVDAVITNVEIATDAMGGSANFKLGLYPGSQSLSAIDNVTDAVDADCFTTTFDVSSAVAMVDKRFAVLNIDTVQKKAWELCSGVSTRPAYDTFRFGIHVSAATASAGTVSVRISYIL